SSSPLRRSGTFLLKARRPPASASIALRAFEPYKTLSKAPSSCVASESRCCWLLVYPRSERLNSPTNFTKNSLNERNKPMEVNIDHLATHLKKLRDEQGEEAYRASLTGFAKNLLSQGETAPFIEK